MGSRELGLITLFLNRQEPKIGFHGRMASGMYHAQTSNPKNANLNPHRPADGSFDMYSVGKIMKAFKMSCGALSAEVGTLANQLMSKAALRPTASDLLQKTLPELFEKLGQRTMQ